MKMTRGLMTAALAAGLAAGLGTGCATLCPGKTAAPPPVVSPPPVPTPTPPAPMPVLAPPPAPAMAVGKETMLKVQVQATGSGADAAAVADALKIHAEGKLAAGGFAVTPNQPEVAVTMAVTTELFDQSGNYFVFDGRTVVSAVRIFDGKLLGKIELNARNERKLGRAAALAALTAKMKDEAASWLAATITPDKMGIAASTLRVRLAWDDVNKDGEFATKFTGKVTQIPGIARCTMEREDYTERMLNFRILHMKDQFPEGMVTRLFATPGLGIVPDVKK